MAGCGKSHPLWNADADCLALFDGHLPGLNGFVGEFTILLGAFGGGMPGGVFSERGRLLAGLAWRR